MFPVTTNALIKNYMGTVSAHIDHVAPQIENDYKTQTPNIIVHQRDLSNRAYSHLVRQDIIAVDTETGGLSPVDDHLHLVQVADVFGNVHIVQKPGPHSTLLRKLLLEDEILKIFHWMKFDLMFLRKGLVDVPQVNEAWEEDHKTCSFLAINLDTNTDKIICTKTMMKALVPGKKASLKDAARWFCKIDLNKEVEHGNWNAEELSERQLEYAANDVLVLFPIAARQCQEWGRMDIDTQMSMNRLTGKVGRVLAEAAYLELNGFTDFLHHGFDNRRCKSPLLRRAEIKDELDDSRDDGDSERPQATSS